MSPPTSTVTEPPTRPYERISAVGGLVVVVVVVGGVVVVVVVVGSGGPVVVVLPLGTVVVDEAMVVVVDVVAGAGMLVVGAGEGSVGGVTGLAREVVVAVIGTMAAGVSVTWSRTLPTAAAATRTAVVVTASQTRTYVMRRTPPSCLNSPVARITVG